MARRTHQFTVTDDGRDKGKQFIVTEMSATAAEDWAMRALFALARSGVDLGDLEGTGMAGIAVKGFLALSRIEISEARALTDDLMKCAKIIRDPNHPETTFEILEHDIEEVKTRLQIKAEVFKIHTGFSLGGASSTNSKAPQRTNAPQASPTTATSRRR